MIYSGDGWRHVVLIMTNAVLLYSKLLCLFRIDYVFTSLRLRVMWRTEQVILLHT